MVAHNIILGKPLVLVLMLVNLLLILSHAIQLYNSNKIILLTLRHYHTLRNKKKLAIPFLLDSSTHRLFLCLFLFNTCALDCLYISLVSVTWLNISTGLIICTCTANHLLHHTMTSNYFLMHV